MRALTYHGSHDVRVETVPDPTILEDDEKVLFMTDILPTGYQAVVNAGVRPGGSLAIFGAGPVGLKPAPGPRSTSSPAGATAAAAPGRRSRHRPSLPTAAIRPGRPQRPARADRARHPWLTRPRSS